MASNIDMSLDDLVTLNKKKGGNKGGGKPFQGKPKPGGGKPKPIGGKPQTSSQQTKNIDLRKVISSKQKAGITDLRTKLKPKALYTSKFANKQMSKSNPTTPKATGKPWPAKSPRFKYETEEIPHSRKSDPGPLLSGRRPNSPKLPTYEEAKKITVTVPGSLQPTTSTEYLREERLAAAIARSRERRHDSHMKGREEFLASSITSALRDRGSERDRGGGIGGTFSRMHMRGFSRSPSPPPMAFHAPLPVPMPRGSVPMAPRPLPPPRTGITTMTSMIIQNLSDTVSKNDVAELCRAMGPVESVQMTHPGIAEVVFKYKDDALEAYKKYNQRNLDGQPMVCRLQSTSRSKLPPPAAHFSGHRPLSTAYTDDFYDPSSRFY